LNWTVAEVRRRHLSRNPLGPIECPNEEERPSLDLVIDSSEVFAEDNNTDELHSPEEEDRDDRARVAGYNWKAEKPCAVKVAGDQHEAVRHGKRCHGKSGKEAEAERLVAEAEDGVHGIAGGRSILCLGLPAARETRS